MAVLPPTIHAAQATVDAHSAPDRRLADTSTAAQTVNATAPAIIIWAAAACSSGPFSSEPTTIPATATEDAPRTASVPATRTTPRRRARAPRRTVPSSRGIRTYLGRRRIQATIPEPADQKKNRLRRGSIGVRPPRFDSEIYKSLFVNGVSCCFWIFLLGLRLGSFGAPARLGWLIGPLTDELPRHDHGGGPQHHRLVMLGQPLVVADQAPVPVEPTETTFHDPVGARNCAHSP